MILNLARAAMMTLLVGQAAANPEDEAIELNPTQLHDEALRVMETYCVSCHGPDKQKGDIRLDALGAIDPVDLRELMASAREAVHFEEMPPEKAEQPGGGHRRSGRECRRSH